MKGVEIKRHLIKGTPFNLYTNEVREHGFSAMRIPVELNGESFQDDFEYPSFRYTDFVDSVSISASKSFTELDDIMKGTEWT